MPEQSRSFVLLGIALGAEKHSPQEPTGQFSRYIHPLLFAKASTTFQYRHWWFPQKVKVGIVGIQILISLVRKPRCEANRSITKIRLNIEIGVVCHRLLYRREPCERGQTGQMRDGSVAVGTRRQVPNSSLAM